MGSKKFFWKVWLRLNALTTDTPNDYIADVSTVGKTLRNEDIANAIKEQGSELQAETLLDILNRADRIICRRVAEGYSVMTGACRISPRVSGSWLGANAHFDEEKHKVTCDMIPSTEMHAFLAEVGVEVLGIKDGGAYIGLVTNAKTGETDGHITLNDDIIIEGEKIRIAPEDDARTGIFFVSEDGTEVKITHRLTQNDPKKVIARVPVMPSGLKTLVIRTRFSTGHLLNEIRSITYNQKLDPTSS